MEKRNQEYHPINIDIEIIAEAPKLNLEHIFKSPTFSSEHDNPPSRESLQNNSGGLQKSSSCTDCKPPTLGLDNTGYQRMVDKGFSYQGHSVDALIHHTPFPLLGIQVGTEYTATLKIFENGNGPMDITHAGIAFGLAKEEHFGNGRAIIEIDRDVPGGEFVLSVTDPGNVMENVHVDTRTGPCLETENDDSQRCLIVDIHHTFREPLEHKKIGTYVWDKYRNGLQNYFNHGIHISGESKNPAKTTDVIHDSKKVTLTMLDIKHTMASDEDGNLWTFDETYNSWTTGYVPVHVQDEDVPLHGLGRTDTRYEEYKDKQALRAQHVLESQIMNGKSIANDEFD